MQYIMAVFRSRTEALTFANILSSYRVPVSVISTPRRLSVSCGICIRFDSRLITIAKDVMLRRKFDTFVGFFI